MKLLTKAAFSRLSWGIAAFGLILPTARATTLFIDPTFGSGITANMETSINAAIAAIDALYSNPVTVDVTFTASNAGATYLLQTTQDYYGVSYSSYVSELEADSTANPSNTTLSTAIAHLSDGNDANGADGMAISGALCAVLGFTCSGGTDNATININTNYTFGYTQPVSTSDYDLTGGLEHELDEVLGGGGAGSTLNSLAGCSGDPSGFFCNKYGPLDLYRYSASGTPSYNNNPSDSAYFSINGGVTNIVNFNNNPSNGDMADFAPACGPGGGNNQTPLQYIQNAQNCMGTDEAYTTSSPEFTMLESIGYDPTSQDLVPEPSTFVLVGSALLGAGFLRRRLQARKNG